MELSIIQNKQDCIQNCDLNTGMLWLSGLFGFVTPETLSCAREKGKLKNVVISIRKLNLLLSVLKEENRTFFWAQVSLQHERDREGSERF